MRATPCRIHTLDLINGVLTLVCYRGCQLSSCLCYTFFRALIKNTQKDHP